MVDGPRHHNSRGQGKKVYRKRRSAGKALENFSGKELGKLMLKSGKLPGV